MDAWMDGLMETFPGLTSFTKSKTLLESKGFDQAHSEYLHHLPVNFALLHLDVTSKLCLSGCDTVGNYFIHLWVWEFLHSNITSSRTNKTQRINERSHLHAAEKCNFCYICVTYWTTKALGEQTFFQQFLDPDTLNCMYSYE